MTDKPTYDELCERYGYLTKADFAAREAGDYAPLQGKHQPYYVSSDSSAGAWSFVMAARGRGWIVSDPMPNGYKDVNHVTVWKVGDFDTNREGQYRYDR